MTNKTVRHLAPTATAEEVHAELAADGVVVVDELVTPDVMDRACEELEPFVAATAVGVDDFSGHRTRRTGALVARSPTCRELVQHPLVLASAKSVLGKATSFQLHLTQLISIDPDEPAQLIHRDQWAFDFFPFPADYDVQCNTIWAMTDFTEENGATRVIPGSNHFEDKLRLTQEDTVPAEMTKGSVLFYTGRLYHGAGANRSRETRRGINITYCVSWLRQEENQYLSVPFEIARTLPTELLRLMGYARGAYALGYVDDARDPIVVLKPEEAQTGLGELDQATVNLDP